jgi:hypothetical protein
MQEVATYASGTYTTFVHSSTANFHVPAASGM